MFVNWFCVCLGYVVVERQRSSRLRYLFLMKRPQVWRTGVGALTARQNTMDTVRCAVCVCCRRRRRRHHWRKRRCPYFLTFGLMLDYITILIYIFLVRFFFLYQYIVFDFGILYSIKIVSHSRCDWACCLWIWLSWIFLSIFIITRKRYRSINTAGWDWT